MRFILSLVHGRIDYLAGVLLLIAPTLFGFGAGGVATGIFSALGLVIILYSLLTDYELGAVPWISVRVHLGIDIAAGILLAASLWLFGFAERVWAPHLVLGLVVIGSGMFTRLEHRRSAAERH